MATELGNTLDNGEMNASKRERTPEQKEAQESRRLKKLEGGRDELKLNPSNDSKKVAPKRPVSRRPAEDHPVLDQHPIDVTAEVPKEKDKKAATPKGDGTGDLFTEIGEGIEEKGSNPLFDLSLGGRGSCGGWGNGLTLELTLSRLRRVYRNGHGIGQYFR